MCMILWYMYMHTYNICLPVFTVHHEAMKRTLLESAVISLSLASYKVVLIKIYMHVSA